MSSYNPDIHHRRRIRLVGYDYSQAGAYFVTICTQDRDCLFGEIVGDTMHLNEYGILVRQVWKWLPEQYPYVSIGELVVMPNHFHGILLIDNHCRTTQNKMHEYGEQDGSRTATTANRKPVGRLIGVFKTVSTKRINELRLSSGNKLWQRNFYEHIIRNNDEYLRIAEYIKNNPLTWKDDKLWTE